MLFWLKKQIGYWIMPVPALVALVALGTLLLWRERTRKLGRALLTVAALLLLFSANKTISGALIRPIETRYPPIPELTSAVPDPLATCRFVVVLGAGNGANPGMASLNLLSSSARARISEAARILRVLPEAGLLVSGPGDPLHATHATVLERAAMSLGVEHTRIHRIEHARDTEDEAAAVKRFVGNAPVALVTSAWHMPRSVALFRAAGVEVVPCPTDYRTHENRPWRLRDLLWDVESLEKTSLAVRERVGYLWISLRGKGLKANSETRKRGA